MCPLLPWRGSCGNWVGSVTGGGKQQGTEVYAVWPTDASTPRPSSMSSCLAARHPYSSRALSKEKLMMLSVCSAFPVPSPPLSIYLFIPILKIKRKMKTHLFHYFFLHSSAFHLTKIYIYANMRHLFPPLPHMGDRSQARINDIALAVMFAAFH